MGSKCQSKIQHQMSMLKYFYRAKTLLFLISALQKCFSSSLISTEHTTTNVAQLSTTGARRWTALLCGEEVRGLIPDSPFPSSYTFFLFTLQKTLGWWETVNPQQQQVIYETPCCARTPIRIGSREIIKMCSGFFAKLLTQHSRWMITFCPIT